MNDGRNPSDHDSGQAMFDYLPRNGAWIGFGAVLLGGLAAHLNPSEGMPGMALGLLMLLPAALAYAAIFSIGGYFWKTWIQDCESRGNSSCETLMPYASLAVTGVLVLAYVYNVLAAPPALSNSIYDLYVHLLLAPYITIGAIFAGTLFGWGISKVAEQILHRDRFRHGRA